MKFNLEIISTNKTFFKGEVTQLNIKIDQGRIGFLANHSPLTSTVNPCDFSYFVDGKVQKGIISFGLIMFVENKATVVVENVFNLDNIPSQSEISKNLNRINERINLNKDKHRNYFLSKKIEFWKVVEKYASA